MDVEDRIRDFIVGELGWRGPRDALTADRQLIAERILDSLGLFQLVTFLETDLGVVVEDEELVPDNFASIAAIAAFVTAKAPAG